MEFTLWAIRRGEEAWQEELITSTTDPGRLLAAREWAKTNGFDRFRISRFTGAAPDFSCTVNR